MRYWIREVAGWLLVVLGLFIFVLVYELCLERKIFESWPITIIGIFVFRGGIHLLKVAIAARICQQAQDRLYPADSRRPALGTRPEISALKGRGGAAPTRASRGS
jgi:hypothetical protein